MLCDFNYELNCAYFFRRNPHGLGKSLQVVAVIVKPARFTGFIDGVPLTEQRLGDRNALCGNVFVDGRPGSGFENAAQVGAAQKEMGREFFQCQIFTDVGIDIRKDLIYLGMIAGGFLVPLLRKSGTVYQMHC